MAVVKADGYGHGSLEVVNATLKAGATHLGVATIQEGIHLRQEGITIPILVLGNIYSPEDLRLCLRWDLMVTISDLKDAIICQNIAESSAKEFYVHIKVDTGMTRLGFDYNESFKIFQHLQKLNKVIISGIYSHLSLADQNDNQESIDFTLDQKNKFEKLISDLGLKSDDSVICHLANSAGTLLGRQFHFDMVRVGLAMYGYNPLAINLGNIHLSPAFNVKAKITFIRDVGSGVGVSYGRNYVTKKSSKLAVVGIGYADGVQRNLSGKINVIYKGQLIPQVGSITMDQMMIDISENEEIQVGSVVTILGNELGQNISPESWAILNKSIPWEILCNFKNRLPRINLKD
tara:strand:- start:1118 stop:2158 length:1041 start_codon:yes stop_codon:yes gene_type:complete